MPALYTHSIPFVLRMHQFHDHSACFGRCIFLKSFRKPKCHFLLYPSQSICTHVESVFHKCCAIVVLVLMGTDAITGSMPTVKWKENKSFSLWIAVVFLREANRRNLLFMLALRGSDSHILGITL
jgi:hypothetical protein